MKHFYLLFLFTISFGYSQTVVPPTNLETYYNGITFSSTNTSLYDNIATTTIGAHGPFLSYSDRHDYLYDADQDPNNTNNVILIYSGESRPDNQWLSGSNPTPTVNQTFNTEHVYPRSLLGTGTAEADLHLLRTCDIAINTSRGNNPFTSGSGTYQALSNSFFPGDDWRGDVARIIMYVNLRYNEPFTDVGTLNLFLEWNAADPVVANGIEDNRNTVISGAQGNRNPFIDNPYLATLIWGGTPAQNRWALLSNEEFQQNQIKIFPNPVKGNEVTILSNKTILAEVYDVLGKKVKTQNITSNQKKLNITGLKKGVYLLRLKSDEGVITKKLIRQ